MDGSSSFEMTNAYWSLRLLLETRSNKSLHTTIAWRSKCPTIIALICQTPTDELGLGI